MKIAKTDSKRYIGKRVTVETQKGFTTIFYVGILLAFDEQTQRFKMAAETIIDHDGIHKKDGIVTVRLTDIKSLNEACEIEELLTHCNSEVRRFGINRMHNDDV